MRRVRLEPVTSPELPEGLQRLSYRRCADDQLDWALLRPADSGDLWWVMIHGHGSSGDQLWTRPDLRSQWWPLVAEHRLGVVGVNLRGNAWMGPSAVEDLSAVLGELRRRFGARRFVFASGSMGGTSNLIYAVRRPADVTGLVALCPATDVGRYYHWCGTDDRNSGTIAAIREAIVAAYGGSPGQQARQYQRHSACRHAVALTMPIYLAHGTADATIPVAESRLLAGRLANHPCFHYQELLGGNHDAPLALMPQAFGWLLQQI